MRAISFSPLRKLLLVLAVLTASTGAALLVPSAASASTGTLTLSAASGLPGTSLVTTGSGFGRRVSGDVYFDGQWLASFSSDKSGRFTRTVTVPAGPARSVVVKAATSTTAAQASFSVLAEAVADTTAPVTEPTTSAPTSPTAQALSETFSGTNGVFVSEGDFWGSTDLGLAKNPTWVATSGSMNRESEAGRATSSNPYFRMWTRQTDLAFPSVQMDLRFNGWYGGTAGWQGVNMWLNRTLCVPQPDCSKINDKGGDAGYIVDFLNRDGSFVILKKVPGPTSDGTYHQLAGTTFTPVTGQNYRIGGRVIDNGNGTATIQALVDGVVKLQVTDTGANGGPILTGGRFGLRGDYADFTVDNLNITK